jgi:ribosomal protein L21E
MGKKTSRSTQTSKGERNNVNKDVIKSLRRDYMNNDLARMKNQIAAFKRGKNVMVTIPNSNPNETNKRFIRVNAKDVWKSNNKFMMKQNTSEGV